LLKAVIKSTKTLAQLVRHSWIMCQFA